MAYIAFVRKGENFACFGLSEQSIVLGRSFDCDVYIPDISVSRRHCSIRPTKGGWEAIDLSSKNGIFFQGTRVARRAMHEGDILELGTVAFRFHEGELPEGLSTPVPFGTGMRLAELMDTLFTGDLRPIEFVRARSRVPSWKSVATPDTTAREEAVEVIDPPMEWTELDLELQVAWQADEMLTPDQLPVWVPAWMAARARAEFGAREADAGAEVQAAAPAASLDQRSAASSAAPRAANVPIAASPRSHSTPRPVRLKSRAGHGATPKVRRRSRSFFHYLAIAREINLDQLLSLGRDLVLERPRLALCVALLAAAGGIGLGAVELTRPTYHLPKNANMSDPNNYTD